MLEMRLREVIMAYQTGRSVKKFPTKMAALKLPLFGGGVTALSISSG
jgi:hypothetical protein